MVLADREFQVVVLAERELQAAVLTGRELQAAVLTEREFQKAVLAVQKETYRAAGREEDGTATEEAEDGTTTEKTKSPTEPYEGLAASYEGRLRNRDEVAEIHGGGTLGTEPWRVSLRANFF